MTLGRRDIDRVRRTVQDYEHRSGQVNTKTDNRIPAPTLAKADADIAAFVSGTFTLQVFKPDEFISGAVKRDAYALTALKAGEYASLHWMVGESSQGYWAALPLGTEQAVDDAIQSLKDCQCALLEAVLEFLTLPDAVQANLREKCDCPTLVDCGGCEIQEEFNMHFQSWSDTTYTTTQIEPDDYIVDLKLSQLNGQTLLWNDMQPNTIGCAYFHTPKPFSDLSFDAIPQTLAASIGLGVNIGVPTPLTYFPSQALVGDRVNGYIGGTSGWVEDIFFNQGTGGRLMELFNPTTTGLFPGCTPMPPDQSGMSFLWNGQPSETVGSGNIGYVKA